MRGYDLTERGKIIIAIILVTLLLIIPAAVLAIIAWSSSPPPDDPPRTVVPGEPPPDISNTPLPEGSGVDPEDPPKPGDGEQGSFDPPVDPPDDPPEFGPVGLDTEAGTMSFLYAPDMQNALDADTISMMGEFVTSPKNTDDSQITVELPQLSQAETSSLISAITDAFAQYSVDHNDITYKQSASDSGERIFEVHLSFTRTTNLK